MRPHATFGQNRRMARTLSILMPVFNERETVEAAIADALGAELPVDGGSS